MGVLLADQALVRSLLPMGECMPIMAEALRALARGDAVLPLRPVMPLPDQRGVLAMMPAWLGNPRVFGLKIISFFPGNLGTPYDCHQGAVLLFDPQDGQLLAILDATSITSIRTAAVSGVATQLLARENARSLAILGSGVQAQSHLDAMLLARRFDHVRVWSRNRDHAVAFAQQSSRRHGITLEVAASVQDAVRAADVICTVTSSREPVLQGDWIPGGAHLNVVGASVRTAREVDAAAVARARLFVDRRESTLAEAGDFLMAKQEGAVGDDHILGELGEVLLGRVPGRRSPDEVTMFKSLGLAVEDLAAAHHVYRHALERGAGTVVELGGAREAP